MKKPLSPRQMCSLFSSNERKRIRSVATILATLVNDYDPRLRCQPVNLLADALGEFNARLQEGKRIPNPLRFTLSTMSDLADKRIDDFVRNYAVDDGGLTILDRDQHVREMLAIIRASLTDADKHTQSNNAQIKDAERVLELMLKGFRLPEIDRICERRLHWSEGVLKRIRRRARTYVRSLIFLRRRS